MFPAVDTHVRFNTVVRFDGAVLALGQPPCKAPPATAAADTCPPVAAVRAEASTAGAAGWPLPPPAATAAAPTPAVVAAAGLPTTTTTSITPPLVTDTYDIGGFLGGGVAGNVYEGVHRGSGDHVAIKILHPIPYRVTP